MALVSNPVRRRVAIKLIKPGMDNRFSDVASPP
jgi:hypothetical protein